MRKLISLAAAGVVFTIVGNVAAFVAVVLRAGSAKNFIQAYFLTPAFLGCAFVTVVGFTLIGSFVDGPLMKLAGRTTVRVRQRYAVAYALLVLGIAMVFFVPFAIGSYPAWTVATTIGIGVVAGFLGGYARGWLMDHWSNKFNSDYPVS